MATERAPHAWTCRPSLFVSRMLGFALAILGVFAVGSVAAYQVYSERADAEMDTMAAAAERQREEQEALGPSVIRRRMAVRAQGDARMIGTVESYRLQSSTEYEPYCIQWRACAIVGVEERIADLGEIADDHPDHP